MHTCQAPPACPRSAASAKLTLLSRCLYHGRAADVRHLQSSTMWSICSPWAWQTWLARADARRQVATKHRDAVCYMRAVDIRRTARAPCKPRRSRHVCACTRVVSGGCAARRAHRRRHLSTRAHVPCRTTRDACTRRNRLRQRQHIKPTQKCKRVQAAAACTHACARLRWPCMHARTRDCVQDTSVEANALRDTMVTLGLLKIIACVLDSGPEKQVGKYTHAHVPSLSNTSPPHAHTRTHARHPHAHGPHACVRNQAPNSNSHQECHYLNGGKADARRLLCRVRGRARRVTWVLPVRGCRSAKRSSSPSSSASRATTSAAKRPSSGTANSCTPSEVVSEHECC